MPVNIIMHKHAPFKTEASCLLSGGVQEYPVEYLLSRIRGKRARLIKNWKIVLREESALDYLASSDYRGFVKERSLDGMWRALLGEYAWVYNQMNENLRRQFAAYFLYAELRTVFMCLRYIVSGRGQKAEELLSKSILSSDMKIALGSGTVETVAAGIEPLLSAWSARFKGIAGMLKEKKLRSFERELINRFFAAVLDSTLHPVIRKFFVRLIDARNIIALFKLQRFGLRDERAFLPGGTISIEQLMNILERNDPFASLPLLHRISGVSAAEPDPAKAETALYRWITRFTKQEARDPLGFGLVLDYLWRCSLEITNLSLLIAGKDIAKDEIDAELVYL